MSRYGKLSIRVDPELVALGFTSPAAWGLADRVFPVRKLPANLKVAFGLRSRKFHGRVKDSYGEFGWLPLSNQCWINVWVPKRLKFPFRGMLVDLNNLAEFITYVFVHELCHFLDFCERSTTGLSEEHAHKVAANAVNLVRRFNARCLKCPRRNSCPTTAPSRRSSPTKPHSCRLSSTSASFGK